MKTGLVLGLGLALTTAIATANAHDAHAKKIHGKWHYTSKADAGSHASKAHYHGGVKYYSAAKKKHHWEHRKAHTSTIGFEDHDKFGN